MLEEAKKRDHKILGPKLDLFSFKRRRRLECLSSTPHGMIVWNRLIEFMRELQRELATSKSKHRQF